MRRLVAPAIALFATACPSPCPQPGAPRIALAAPLRVAVSGPGGSALEDGTFFIGRARTADADRFYDPERGEAEDVQWLPVDAAPEARCGPWRGQADDVEVAVAPAPEGSVAVELTPRDRTRVELIRFRATIAPGPVYGGGEQFVSYNLAGRTTALFMRLGGPNGTNEVHVPVPLASSPKGWGVFFDTPRPGAFRVDGATFEATFAASSLRAVFVPGGVEKTARVYTAITGPPRVPPAWAFMPQQWRNEHRDGAQVLEDARAMRDADIPGSTIWIDNPWQTAYSTFEFNPVKYPGSRDLVLALNALGYRVIVWSAPYLNLSDDSVARPGMTADNLALFAEAQARRFLVRTADDTPFVVPWGWGAGASIDFTHPDAVAFWQSLLDRVLDVGVDGFKLDYGEEILAEALGAKLRLVFKNRRDTGDLHRLHGDLVHRAFVERLEARRSDGGFVIARSGGVGGQAFVSAIWPGDLDHDFSRPSATKVGGLPAALAAAVSLSVSGYPFFGSDIGGYRGGTPTTEALLRWAQLQSVLPIMQLGGGGSHHNPWDAATFGPEALPIYRRYARLHADLLPYHLALARRARETGEPPVLPPSVLDPDDPALAAVDDEFLYGPALLVAPVIVAGATTRSVLFPAGRWYEYAGDGEFVGPSAVSVAAPLDTLPLYLREGGVLVLLPEGVDTLAPASEPGVVVGDLAGALRIVVAPGPGDTSLVLAGGGRGAARRDGSRATVRLAELPPEAPRRFEVRLPGGTRVSEVRFDGAVLPVVAARSEVDTCRRCASIEPGRVTAAVDRGVGELSTR